MIKENGIYLGDISFGSIYPKDSIYNEETLDKIFKTGNASVCIYPGESFTVPHFHIIFKSNDNHKKQDPSRRAYQCCIKIFEPEYFQHEIDKSDNLTLYRKEGEFLNKFMDKPYNKAIRTKIPDWIIYSPNELLAIQKGEIKKDKIITN